MNKTQCLVKRSRKFTDTFHYEVNLHDVSRLIPVNVGEELGISPQSIRRLSKRTQSRYNFDETKTLLTLHIEKVFGFFSLLSGVLKAKPCEATGKK